MAVHLDTSEITFSSEVLNMKMRFFQESSIYVSIRPLVTEEATRVMVRPGDGGITVRLQRFQSRVPNTMLSSLLIMGIDTLEYDDALVKIGRLTAHYRPDAVVVVQREPRLDVPWFCAAPFDLDHFRQLEMPSGDGRAYLSRSLRSPIRHWEKFSYPDYTYGGVEMSLGHAVRNQHNLDNE